MVFSNWSPGRDAHGKEFVAVSRLLFGHRGSSHDLSILPEYDHGVSSSCMVDSIKKIDVAAEDMLDLLQQKKKKGKRWLKPAEERLTRSRCLKLTERLVDDTVVVAVDEKKKIVSESNASIPVGPFLSRCLCYPTYQQEMKTRYPERLRFCYLRIGDFELDEPESYIVVSKLKDITLDPQSGTCGQRPLDRCCDTTYQKGDGLEKKRPRFQELDELVCSWFKQDDEDEPPPLKRRHCS